MWSTAELATMEAGCLLVVSLVKQASAATAGMRERMMSKTAERVVVRCSASAELDGQTNVMYLVIQKKLDEV
jgi:hypothetical protein